MVLKKFTQQIPYPRNKTLDSKYKAKRDSNHKIDWDLWLGPSPTLGCWGPGYYGGGWDVGKQSSCSIWRKCLAIQVGDQARNMLGWTKLTLNWSINLVSSKVLSNIGSEDCSTFSFRTHSACPRQGISGRLLRGLGRGQHCSVVHGWTVVFSKYWVFLSVSTPLERIGQFPGFDLSSRSSER